MNELNIQIEQKPGVITANFDELKEALATQMTAYEDYVVTEENISEAKKDVAVLRKIKGAIDDRRKEIKRDFSKPLNDFEKEVKEMMEIIDSPIRTINLKLTEFEEARIEEKQKHIKELYEQAIGEYREYLPLENISKPQWKNKTCTDKDIINDISEAKTVVMGELAAIKALNSEIENELLRVYKNSGNSLTTAIQKNSDYLAAKQMAEQRVREEAERKAREEAERQAQIEAERKEEVKEVPIVESVTEDLAVANEQVVSFVISGKDNIEKARMILNLEEIPYKEI